MRSPGAQLYEENDRGIYAPTSCSAFIHFTRLRCGAGRKSASRRISTKSSDHTAGHKHTAPCRVRHQYAVCAIGYTDQHIHTDQHTNRNSDTNGDLHTHIHADGYTDSNRYAFTNTDADWPDLLP